MPLNINTAVDYATDRAKQLPFVGTWTKSPILTSALIAIAVVIILLVIFHDVDLSDNNEGIGKLALRTGVYTFLTVLVIEFVQSHNILSKARGNGRNDHMEKVLNQDVRGPSNFAMMSGPNNQAESGPVAQSRDQPGNLPSFGSENARIMTYGNSINGL